MRTPIARGKAGTAWQLDPEPKSPDSYLIHAPGQSAAWEHYVLALLDLDGPDARGRDASRDFPDARWEYAVFALDSTHHPDPDNPAATFRYLLPQNVRVQTPDHPQDLAIATLKATVVAACAGILPLEPAGSSHHPLSAHWRAIIEGTMEHPHHGGDRG